MSSRQYQFDILKGIGILSIIVGHIWRESFFYIFHVPLFFLVSGYFFKSSSVKDSLIKGVKGLLLYYLITGLVTFFLMFALGRPEAMNYLRNFLYDYGKDGISVGPIWFLVALFYCRVIYNILQKILSPLIILGLVSIMTIVQYLGSKYLDYSIIPFGIITIIPALFFFTTGHYWKLVFINNSLAQKPLFIGSVALLSILLTFFQVNYPLLSLIYGWMSFYPFCILNALCITFLLYQFSLLLCSKEGFFQRFLIFCGQNSLMILLFHNIEDRLFIPYTDSILVLHTYPFRYVVFVIIIMMNIFFALLFAWLVNRVKSMNKYRKFSS